MSCFIGFNFIKPNLDIFQEFVVMLDEERIADMKRSVMQNMINRFVVQTLN